MLTKILTSVLIILFALLAFPISQLVEKSNAFKKVNNLNKDKCKILFEKEIEACEDVELVRSKNSAILSCGSLKNRDGWWPAQGNFDMQTFEKQPNDKFILFDYQKEKIKTISIQNSPEKLVLHGISLYNEKFLAAVNHIYPKSGIEFFHYDSEKEELKHMETVTNDLIWSPNDLVLVDENSFYFTNDHLFKKGFMRKVEEYIQLPLGQVVFCHRKDSKQKFECKVVADHITYPNGIAYQELETKEELYVSLTGGAAVSVYTRSPKGDLTYQSKIDLNFLPDNLNIEPESGNIYVAGHPKLLNYVLSLKKEKWISIAKTMESVLPSFLLKLVKEKLKIKKDLSQYLKTEFFPYSQVDRIQNNTDPDWFTGKSLKAKTVLIDDGLRNGLQGSSAAAIDAKANKMIIGLLTSKGIGLCNLK